MAEVVISPSNTWVMKKLNKAEKSSNAYNTVTSMVHYQNAKGEEVKCTPAEYCLRVKTETKNPNREIKMDVNGETLRVSRLRNACFTIQGEHDDNYAGKDILVEMGPKPSVGRRLKHVVEIYGKGKVGRHMVLIQRCRWLWSVSSSQDFRR